MGRKHVPPKFLCPPTKLYGVTMQRITVLMITSVKAEVKFLASRPTPNLNYQGVHIFRLVEHGWLYQELLPPLA
jgi:hypothetical protein